MNKFYNLALRHKASERGRMDGYRAVLSNDRVTNPYCFPITEEKTMMAAAWRESFDETYSKHRRDKNETPR